MSCLSNGSKLIAPIAVRTAQTAMFTARRRRRRVYPSGDGHRRMRRSGRPIAEDYDRYVKHMNPRSLPFQGMPVRSRSTTKATRSYKQVMTVANFAAIGSSGYIGFSVLNTIAGGAQSLTAYSGRAVAATGTVLTTFLDFPEEAKAMNNLYKWMNIDSVQARFIPFAAQATVDSTQAVDQNALTECGEVWIGTHAGNEAYFAPATGLTTVDRVNTERMPHKTFLPVGTRDAFIACEPHSTQLTDNQYGNDQITYRRTPPISTQLMMNSATEYPFYGLWWFWTHPALSADAAKFIFGLELTVTISWNTVQDANLVALAAQRQSESLQQMSHQLAGQPSCYRTSEGKPVCKLSQDPLGLDQKDDCLVEDTIPLDRPVLVRSSVNQQAPLELQDLLAVKKPIIAGRILTQHRPTSRPSTPVSK